MRSRQVASQIQLGFDGTTHGGNLSLLYAMIPTGHKFSIGLVPCSFFGLSDFLQHIRDCLSSGKRNNRILTCINAHIYNLAVADKKLSTLLQKADCVVADGMSIVWAARFFGVHLPGRCNMTEAFHGFLKDSSMPSSKAILIGGKAGTAVRATEAMHRQSTHCHILEACDGYQEIQHYEKFFEQHSDIDLVLLGMGSPRSEYTAEIASRTCRNALIWHIGGGTLRFLAGELKEAPAWMRHSGLQWVHRLILEPRRMWKRYVIGNVLFILHIARALLPPRRKATRSADGS